MINILYIAKPDDPVDSKWYNFFSNEQNNEFNVYLTFENMNGEFNYNTVRPKLLTSNVQLLPPFSPFSFKNPLKSFKTINLINDYIRIYKIQILHILYTMPDAIWLNFIRNIKTILSTQGTDVLVTLPSLFREKKKFNIKSLLLFYLLQRAFCKANYVTSTSNIQVEYIYKFFKIRSHLIRTGIDIREVINKNNEKLLPKLLKERPYIFFPRFLFPIYNHELEILSLKLLEEHIVQKFTFVFVRHISPDKEYESKIINSLNEIKGINYLILDFMDKNMFSTLIKNMTLGIMIPITDGTPSSALEAMTLGKPIILGTADYDDEIFSNACLKLTKNDPLQLAHLINLAIINYPSQLLETAKIRVKKFADRFEQMMKLKQLYLTN